MVGVRAFVDQHREGACSKPYAAYSPNPIKTDATSIMGDVKRERWIHN